MRTEERMNSSVTGTAKPKVWSSYLWFALGLVRKSLVTVTWWHSQFHQSTFVSCGHWSSAASRSYRPIVCGACLVGVPQYFETEGDNLSTGWCKIGDQEGCGSQNVGGSSSEADSHPKASTPPMIQAIQAARISAEPDDATKNLAVLGVWPTSVWDIDVIGVPHRSWPHAKIAKLKKLIRSLMRKMRKTKPKLKLMNKNSQTSSKQTATATSRNSTCPWAIALTKNKSLKGWAQVLRTILTALLGLSIFSHHSYYLYTYIISYGRNGVHIPKHVETAWNCEVSNYGVLGRIAKRLSKYSCDVAEAGCDLGEHLVQLMI